MVSKNTRVKRNDINLVLRDQKVNLHKQMINHYTYR